MEDFLEMLNHSYEQIKSFDECIETKLEYLGDYIFEFTTYDGEMSALFATKAVEICGAISTRSTFKYIKDTEDYKWFLLMCNMPFFSEKIEWGTSIRGCWWDSYEGIEIETTGLFKGDKQMLKVKFNESEWKNFLSALVLFIKETR